MRGHGGVFKHWVFWVAFSIKFMELVNKSSSLDSWSFWWVYCKGFYFSKQLNKLTFGVAFCQQFAWLSSALTTTWGRCWLDLGFVTEIKHHQTVLDVSVTRCRQQAGGIVRSSCSSCSCVFWCGQPLLYPGQATRDQNPRFWHLLLGWSVL